MHGFSAFFEECLTPVTPFRRALPLPATWCISVPLQKMFIVIIVMCIRRMQLFDIAFVCFLLCSVVFCCFLLFSIVFYCFLYCYYINVCASFLMVHPCIFALRMRPSRLNEACHEIVLSLHSMDMDIYGTSA